MVKLYDGCLDKVLYLNSDLARKNKVIRGGGGIGDYTLNMFFHDAARQYAEMELRSEGVGFRCAKSS